MEIRYVDLIEQMQEDGYKYSKSLTSMVLNGKRYSIVIDIEELEEVENSE